MGLVCIGLNHETAPVQVREHFAVGAEEQGKRALDVIDQAGVEEAVMISTCNRTEIFASTSSLEKLRRYMEKGHDADEADCLYVKEEDEARRHLFRLVSGLDSMVLGETEIFGQVKKAYQLALEAGATKGTLNQLFQKSFSVGKKVRSTTSIQMGQTSVGNVAVDLAEKIFGKLTGSDVMVIGAGETSRLVAKSLMSRGANRLTITNRTDSKAQELAEELGGEAVPFHSWAGALAHVDVLVSSTGATEPVLRAPQVEAVRRTRKYRPLFMIDIAVPRDIEPAIGDIDEVYLYNLDKLQKLAEDARNLREKQIVICEEIIEQEL